MKMVEYIRAIANNRRRILSVLAVLILIVFVGKMFIKPSLKKMSPKQVVNLYHKARENGDAELLEKILYFPPETSQEQRKAKAKSLLSGRDEKGMMKMVGAKVSAEYEEIIDDSTAEVGLVIHAGIPGFKDRIPIGQVLLRRENSVWKYAKSKYELTEDELVTKIRENPYDASAIYHLGRKYQPENPAKANRYFLKYYDLEPKGFWISKEFLWSVTKNKDGDQDEIILLEDLQNIPKQSPARATAFWTLGQIYAGRGEYEKARDHFDKAEKALKSLRQKHTRHNEKFKKAKSAFLATMNNQDTDILAELESQGVYK